MVPPASRDHSRLRSARAKPPRRRQSCMFVPPRGAMGAGWTLKRSTMLGAAPTVTSIAKLATCSMVATCGAHRSLCELEARLDDPSGPREW